MSADYAEYRKFLKDFAATVDPNDQLPVRVGGYNITEDEVTGEVIDWTIQYLAEKKCPPTLVAPIVQTVITELKQSCHKNPEQCGFVNKDNIYQPLKLMHTVTSLINDICLRLLDNSQLDKIPPPPKSSTEAPPKYAVSAVKNTRRKMEDRHVCIDDLDAIYGITDNPERTSYYAIFDGHAGQSAASYAVSHLHRFLINNSNYATDPVVALREAVWSTDLAFVEKCQLEHLSSGTTALCVLYRPYNLYIAWVGDSQALLVREGQIFQIVKPHRPGDEDERARINKQGGVVMLWSGSWRVNGRLAVSRAIGDALYKPYVTGQPDIKHIPLDGHEDFVILACDGLWDYVTEDDAAINVYRSVRHDPDNLDEVTQSLVKLSKLQGSADNISVIVVFLKDPHVIATSSWPSASIPPPIDNMETAYDTNQEPQKNVYDMMDFEIKASNGTSEIQMPVLPSDVDNDNYTTNNINDNLTTTTTQFNEFTESFPGSKHITQSTTITTTTTTNGKRPADDVEEYDDLGPETDVDTLDEVMTSPKELKEDNQFDDKEMCELNDLVDDQFNVVKHNNPFSMDFGGSGDHQFQSTNEHLFDNEPHIPHPEFETNPFDDNKLRDLMEEEDETKVTSELVEKVLSSRDHNILEKKDTSFEKEVHDDDEGINLINELTNEPLEKPFDLAAEVSKQVEAVAQSQFHDIYQPQENLMFDESNNSQVLETSATAEHVVAESGGEDSEDEWNYIKVDKKTLEEDIKIESTEQEVKNNKLEQLIEENPQQSEALQQQLLSEPTIAVELLGEVTTGLTDDTHFKAANINISQEIGETQEACIDLIEGNPEEPEQELVDLEKNSLLEGIQQDSNLDDDDMSSQLNPDAKEFVPISPVRSAPSSPLGLDVAATITNGNSPALVNPHLSLINEDAVIAQSPRKGTPMENITVPSENEFDQEIAKRPSEVEEMADNLLSGCDYIRPESASSQGSYQEMNLKEAMHGDEKLELNEDGVERLVMSQDIITPVEEGAKVLSESDPMNMSFYHDKEDDANPFDLNAVQKLPVDDTEDTSLEDENFDKMSEEALVGIALNKNLVSEQWPNSNDETSKPEEDMYSPSSVVADILPLEMESDKPESELQLQSDNTNVVTDSLIGAAQNVASEITTFLNTVNEQTSESPVEVHFEAESFVEQIKSPTNFDKYTESGLSPVANEFNPTHSPSLLPESSEMKMADLAESDSSLVKTDEVNIEDSEDFQAFKKVIESATQIATSAVNAEIPHTDNIENKVDASPAEEIIEPTLISTQENTPVEAVNGTVETIEIDPQSLHLTSLQSAIADVVTTAAAETMVVTKVDEKPAEPLVKKAEVKSKTSTSAVSKTASKPTTAANKKPSTLNATAKPLASKFSTTTTTTARPKTASSPTKPTSTLAEKKTSMTTTAAAKKPATASDTSKPSVPSVRRSTTTTKPASTIGAKPSSGTIKPATTRPPVAAAPKPLTTAPKTAPSATPRTSLAARTSSITKAPASKVAATGTTTSAAAPKPRPPTGTTATSRTALTSRAPLSPTKPRLPATGATNTTTVDKQTKDTANKSRTLSSTSTLNSTNKLTSPRTTTTTVRKTTIDKSPSVAKTRLSTTTTSTTTTVTTTGGRTTSGTGVGLKKSTTSSTGGGARSTLLNKKTTISSPKSKPTTNGNNKSASAGGATKVTTVKIEKEIVNGEVITQTEIVNTQIIQNNETLNGDSLIIQKNEINNDENLADNNSQQQQMIVIDSATD